MTRVHAEAERSISTAAENKRRIGNTKRTELQSSLLVGADIIRP